MKIVVIGAGLAGLSAAIAAGRRGHDVVVVDRDDHPPPPAASDAFDAWARSGVGHFRQPHTFLGLGRKTLYDHAPDIVGRLLAVGASEFDQRTLLPDVEFGPDDAELGTILCRRPVFEAVLREVASETPGVTVASGVVVDGLVARPRGGGVDIVGVHADGSTVDADLVIDASGRTSKTRSWLEAAGAELADRQQGDCGIVYFSRHFRLRPDAERPAGAYVFGGPRGDLGYLAFAVMVGDQRTFSIVIVTRPEDTDFKPLRNADAWLALAQQVPALADWVDPGRSEPISPVLFMGRLNNTIQPLHASLGGLRGIRTIGDALSHVNPTVALGAAVSLEHGFAMGPLLDEHGDVGELSEAFEAHFLPELQARFNAVSAEDSERLRMWAGEIADPFDPNESLALAIRTAVYPAATRDPVRPAADRPASERAAVGR